MRSIICCLLVVIGATSDPCQELCNLDGPRVCSKGSREKKGKCHRYYMQGENRCYHTSATAHVCPKSSHALTVEEAERILGPVRPTVHAEALSDKPKKARKESSMISNGRGEVYSFVSTLGSGSQGKVYLGRRESDGHMFAVKEIFAKSEASFTNELNTLRILRGVYGFPQLIDEFSYRGLKYVVMQRLGRSISKIRTSRTGSSEPLAVPVVGAIALQMIDRMQTLHELGIVHMDLFNYNSVMGLDDDKFKLFVIDFGRARPVGQVSRKVDVKSLCHTVLRLIVPKTPFKDTIQGQPFEVVCRGLPIAVLRLFRYAYESLGGKDTPNYDYLRGLMRELAPHYSGIIPLE